MDKILLTIDVEDWFQVENFRPWIPFSSWPNRELRVEKNTHRLLDLFDSIQSKQPKAQKRCQSGKSFQIRNTPKGTFFILGWIAERLPELVREIHARGHEVASHGYNHNLCYQESHEDLKKDLSESKKRLEDIIGSPVFGYRAPNFSISDTTLKIIQDSGYSYDSSYNSFDKNGRYGQIPLFKKDIKGAVFQVAANFYEIPISNLRLGKHIIPWGGGGYFRLLPLRIFQWGVQSILKNENFYVYYIHPWEIDPKQPRVNKASLGYKFRHYYNLKKNYSRLSSFLEYFDLCHFVPCNQYLEKIAPEINVEKY